ncbi:MAG TPA: hypothetical protein VLX61_05530 [Anaerolineales bacterium]|nr:hypothetical protein [Anaerolineales bacterium]
MIPRKFVICLAGSFLILASLACNIGARRPTPIPASDPASNPAGVSTESSAATATPSAPQPSATLPALTDTPSSPTITATPQNPLVTTTAYCWSGPTGKALSYEIISSIQAGTRVQLLGKGIVDGWWIVRNPRYNDPCWIQQQYVQIDPSYDLSALKTYAVPPTPTATP